MQPSRPFPRVGDVVTVQYLGSERAGTIVVVEARRLLVRTEAGEEWFALSRTTARFVREGEAYFPRLLWRGTAPPSGDDPPG
jgi:hypothetical protein